MITPITVSAIEDGVRLHRWFLRHYNLGMIELRKLCRTGAVRVNSRRAKPDDILCAGDMVRVPPTLTATEKEVSAKKIEPRDETGARFSLSDLESLRKCILHDDADIVVFNKPAGLSAQGGTGIRKSLDKMAAALFPHDAPVLVHRLDRETSGVIVMAKNHNAAQNLSAQFAGRDAHKEYLALLSGNVSPLSGTIDNYIVRGRILSEREVSDMKRAGTTPQRAITKYTVLANLPGVLAWVKFLPQTGRMHQLRIHSAFSLHAPIVGDELYGGELVDNKLLELVGTKHLFLFAHRITFRHPKTNKIMTIIAPLPDFMTGVAKLLELKTE